MGAPKVKKVLLVPDRLRRPPREGWSWIDRRFLRDHAPSLPGDAILLYFFLAAVSDRQGLSYWGDAAIAGRLRLVEDQVARAREELEARHLIAYQAPVYQVLSLPRSRFATKARGLRPLRDVFAELAREPRQQSSRRRAPAGDSET